MDELDKFLQSRINIFQKEEINVSYNHDELLINIKEGEIPLFAEMVFKDKHLTKKAIKEFEIKFWKKFSNPKNSKYRKSAIGKYLFWFNQKFIGLIKNLKDTDKYGTGLDDRYLIQITNFCESAYSSIDLESSYSNDLNVEKNIVNKYINVF